MNTGTAASTPRASTNTPDASRWAAAVKSSSAGGDPDADYVAVWDGVGWSALVGPGGGITSTVYDLVEDAAGNIYAVGDFSNAGGDPDADGVARWNGSSWSSLGGPGSGVYTTVRAVAVDDLGRVYVGGDFFDLGGHPDADPSPCGMAPPGSLSASG